MGICNIAMGSLAFFCGTCGGGALLFVYRVTPDLVEFMNQRIVGYLGWEIAKHVVSLLLGTFLIIGGIGLLMEKRWGWLLTLFCSLFTLIQQIAYAFFQFLFVLPGVHEFERQFRGVDLSSPGEQGRAFGNIIGILFAAGIHCVYALVALVVLLLPNTLRELKAAETERDREEEQRPGPESDDDDWQERPRRVT
jgi:hypothetical protein